MVLRGVRRFSSVLVGALDRAVLVRRAGLALVTLAFVSLAFAGRADAFVYWANSPGGNGGTIGRANLDGTGVNEGFITGGSTAQGMAVDGSYVFWANQGSGQIGRANLDGTGVNQSFIGATSPDGVAADGTHVYWADTLDNPPNDGVIARANVDGTGVDDTFINLGRGIGPQAVAVDGNHVYWTQGGSIGRANLDGTGVNQHFITGLQTGEGLAVDGEHIYWTSGQNGTIGRANLDGTGVNQKFITGAIIPEGMAVDSAHIYWANSQGGPDSGGSIGRANLDGTGVNQNFITEPSSSFPDGLAVNALLGGPKPHVCSGSFTTPGVLKGGYPNGVVVKGVCEVNSGKAHVVGTLTVTKGSALAAAFGEHHSSLEVNGNLVVDKGAVVVLGCKANPNGTGMACLDDHSKHPTLTSHASVSGNIIASHALGLIVHNSAIGQSIKDIGGGGGPTCAVPKTGIFAAFKSPVFSDLEDSFVGGDVRMNGLRTCWFGLARDTVQSYVTININKTADPDAIEVLANHIGKSLSCAGNRHPGRQPKGALPIWDSADATESGLYPRSRSPTPWAAAAAASA